MRGTRGVAASNRDRAKGAVAAVVLPGVLGYALLTGLAVRLPVLAQQEALATFDALPPPQPPQRRIVPDPVRRPRPQGEASPPDLRSKATQLVAPPPILPPIAPPPIVVALKAGPGNDATSGAAAVAGPGTGAGGIGDGFGSGGAGDGDGGGGGETPPRWRRGRIRDSDFPRAAAEAGFSGKVSIRFLVATDGRIADCAITRSSGRADVDATTCSLIRRRYRFDPSLDADGRPVPAYVVEDHEWVFERLPPEEE